MVGKVRQLFPLLFIFFNSCLSFCSNWTQVSRWGHVYLDGAFESLEFFTAADSSFFPCESLPTVLLNYSEVCNFASVQLDLNHTAVVLNAIEYTSDFGDSCTLAEKVILLRNLGVRVVAVVNKDNSLYELSESFGGSEKNIAVVMLKQRAGMILRFFFDHFRRDDYILKSKFLGEYYDIHTDSNVPCGPCLNSLNYSFGNSHNESVKKLPTGAVEISRTGKIFEFVQAETGAPILLKSIIRLHLSSFYFDGCAPFVIQNISIGQGILIDRGNCSFLTKLVHAEQAGASFVVFVNDAQSELISPYIEKHFTNPAFKTTFSTATLLPSIMISNWAGCSIRNNSSSFVEIYLRQVDLNLVQDESIVGNIIAQILETGFWTYFEKLRETNLEDLIIQLNLKHKDSDITGILSDRVQSLRSLYLSERNMTI